MKRIVIVWMGASVVTALALGRAIKRNDDWQQWEQEMRKQEVAA